MKLLLRFWLILTLILFFTPTPSVLAAGFETGGTNYVVYELGKYFDDPNDTTYLQPDNTPGGLKTVIGSYDQNPAKVADDLQAMCAAGQRKIALMIWFADFPDGMGQDVSYGGMINSRLGRLTDRHNNNLLAVLALIKNARAAAGQPCFNELQFRFAPYSNAAAQGWTDWNEQQYLQNKSFIFSTRDLITATLNGSPVSVLFDLGAEEGGRMDEGQLAPYHERLWREYLTAYGHTDTYGFSIALVPNRFTRSLTIYDRVGIRPNQYAIDIYDLDNHGMLPQLQVLKNEMQQWGEFSKPVIIQETYYKDDQAWQELTDAKETLGLTIRTIMQWQSERNNMVLPDGRLRHYTTTSPDYIYAVPPGLPAVAGDLNADGRVDIFDYNLLVTNFGNLYTIFDYNNLVANFDKQL